MHTSGFVRSLGLRLDALGVDPAELQTRSMPLPCRRIVLPHFSARRQVSRSPKGTSRPTLMMRFHPPERSTQLPMFRSKHSAKT